MNSNYTDISIILDESGSMFSLVKETLIGFNNFVSEQKKLPGKCLLTLTLFDTNFNILHSGVDINNVPELTTKEYSPDGYTALLDAIGNTINSVGKRLDKMPENERPAKVVIVIITDGEENSSKEFTRDQIFEMIKLQRETYNWQFIFLGANQDAIKTGNSYGISASNPMSYAATSKGTTATYSVVSQNLTKYRLADGNNADQAIKFDDSQRNSVV